MRNKCILLVILAFTLAASNGFAQELKFTSANTPESRVNNFYSWYLKALNHGNAPATDVMNSNSSRRFSRSYFSKAHQDADSDSIEYDVFLNSREWNQDWADTMNVGKATIKGKTAVVRVKLSDTIDDFVLTLQISLVKEAGVWKIDRVTSKGGRATR